MKPSCPLTFFSATTSLNSNFVASLYVTNSFADLFFSSILEAQKSICPADTTNIVYQIDFQVLSL